MGAWGGRAEVPETSPEGCDVASRRQANWAGLFINHHKDSFPTWAPRSRTQAERRAFTYLLLPACAPSSTGSCTVAHFGALNAWACRSLTVWGDLILPAPGLTCGVTLGRALKQHFLIRQAETAVGPRGYV